MSRKKDGSHLLRTKLHRPSVPVDLVVRPRLIETLERGRSALLTLISAPAGYGKSTLISSWLYQCDSPVTWLSLDDGDNDLAVFLSYFVAAVQELFPRACSQTAIALRGSELPPMEILARELVNEITDVGKHFTLVLDDYGLIHDTAVHDLLSLLLDQKLRNLHLVVSTRRDPSLPLSSFRAGGLMTEIRQADLQLTLEETAVFLEKSAQISLDKKALAQLHEQTEGWAVGLRMVALAFVGRHDMKERLQKMKTDSRHIREYLLSEVLDRQSPEIRNCLLKTSILDRFSAPLCEYICHSETNGEEFIEQIEESNLFSIALDEGHEWFRYHHLFRDLLQQKLYHHFKSGEIEELHKRASIWFEKRGLLEESLYHALKCCDTGDATQLIIRHRHNLMNQEQWHRLRQWIHMIPRETVDQNPELLIVEAWLYIGWAEMAGIMTKIESLLSAIPKDTKEARSLQAEWDILRALVHYHITEGHQAIDCLQKALKELPSYCASERGLGTMLLSMSYQMIGDLKKSRSVLFSALQDKREHDATYRGRVLLTFCFICSMEADLDGSMQSARECLKMGQEEGLPEILAHGHYFLGICSYERNDLIAAERYLQPVAEGPFIVNSHNFAFSAFALALTLLAEDRPGRAHEVVDMVIKHALQTNNISLLQTAQAFQAELQIRQRKITEAGHWARSFDPDPFTVAYRFYFPQMTLAKWYLLQDTTDGYRQAADLLIRLHEFFSSTHNSRLLIEVLTLQALLHDAQGEEPGAFDRLTKALTLAEPGGFIRIFLDLGPAMAELLSKLARQNIAVNYIRRLLKAFRDETIGTVKDVHTIRLSSLENGALVDPLSNREIAVLTLLSQRLTNKEIAEKLFISAATVKKHTINIYQKLDVNSRREAVAKATSMGIL